MAEFESPGELLEAARRAREEGYGKMDAYTPYPDPRADGGARAPPTKLPLVVLAGGIVGCATALVMQWFAATVHYPINVGGRPLASWPMFIPITFELTVLFASLAAVLGMLGMNGLPDALPPRLQRAAVRARVARPLLPLHRGGDPMFDLEKTSRFLRRSARAS